MPEAVLIIAVVIGLPLLIPIIAMLLKHQQQMATLQPDDSAIDSKFEQLTGEYQDFVLGVDSRIQRLEERIRTLEGKLRQAGESEDNQQVRRIQ